MSHLQAKSPCQSNDYMVIDHTLTFNAPFGEESNNALSKLFNRERLNNQDKTLLY